MKHSKSALILMELIIVILFFSLASTVCIQLFAKSHLLSKQTVNENQAVIHAQNMAECFLATEGNLDEISSLLGASTSTSANTATLLFDKNWSSCDANCAQYVAQLLLQPEENGLITARISVEHYMEDASTEPIYSLTVMHHIPERRSNLD